ncbi:MAG: hypothetical protein GYB67_06880 [Chloroflexi bacterium]|nr:hypothetical protein [Chloroflexota bacterium]
MQQINVNIITIYNINITLDPSDPLLTIIQLGDVIQVVGVIVGNVNVITPTVTIVAVNITFISVNVVIFNGLIWRDPGDCTNPPPQWVLDQGGGTLWLIRCTAPQPPNVGPPPPGGGAPPPAPPRPPSGGGGGGDDDDD